MSQAGEQALSYAWGQAEPSASVLGRITYGREAADGRADLQVPMAVLPAGGGVATDWLGAGPFTQGTLQGCRYRANAALLFGVVQLAESRFEARGDVSALEQASRAAYERVFAVLAELGYPALVRCWNYIPQINQTHAGMERYRAFNVGRQEAFIASGRSCHEHLPAASALGTADGDFLLYFLAARTQPVSIENPRQLSAFRYPEQYGPRSPSFARASLLSLPPGETLFVSGTASIVGHESVHLEDVVAQTLETMVNIDTLVTEANRVSAQHRFSSAALDYKVFIRDPADQPAVADAMARHLGAVPHAFYVQADVCRRELLVEIEAVGRGVAR
jgi:enamine deaminase RidA (YjgF/YER057c/UK114 family)